MIRSWARLSCSSKHWLLLAFSWRTVTRGPAAVCPSRNRCSCHTDRTVNTTPTWTRHRPRSCPRYSAVPRPTTRRSCLTCTARRQKTARVSWFHLIYLAVPVVLIYVFQVVVSIWRFLEFNHYFILYLPYKHVNWWRPMDRELSLDFELVQVSKQ